ncbi:copper amine oxidase [Hoyosella sp. G463]|uniref:Copper amine oxidase n=1 Tax=Lolliginicoccus lacisalsi TaxID=2742202 RepID=A0A927PKN7_9ACTN|nr:copper amine oxidase [Lolliginicoccus lacisalsi]MBD8504979.1 copper amine oxidase [Lolliginicoccus lacisalsi]
MLKISKTQLAALATAGVLAGGVVTVGTTSSFLDRTYTPGEIVLVQDSSVTAEELRIILERQLGQHAMLAVEAMRAGVAGQPQFDAAAASLGQNTEDLTESIRLVYGDEAAGQFNELWSNHIGFFVDFTVGLAEDDQQAQDEAIQRLDQYRADFGGFLDGATDGELPANAVADLLQMHVDQLVEQVRAYAAGDYTTAAAQTREAYAHMFGTAQGLAGAISTTQDGITGSVENQAIDLRSGLGQQLGEHAQLAVQAMRAGVTGGEDFEALAGALNENTQDLTASISGVFGEEGGQAFMEMWSDHIDFFVQYTVGVAEEDEQAQEDALERLSQYRQDFSQFLDTASNGNIPADVVADGLQTHVNQLVAQIDAYHAGDYETAFSEAYDAYTHMYGTAEALAAGIVAFMSDSMPAGGVETGAGGAVK